MEYLIDTHTFLWFNNGSKQINKNIKEILTSADNTIFLSMASIWEISIKNSLQKLELLGGFQSVISDIEINNFRILDINLNHIIIQNTLEFHHRDPFDRLIISQGISENINTLSNDNIFDKYLTYTSIKRIW